MQRHKIFTCAGRQSIKVHVTIVRIRRASYVFVDGQIRLIKGVSHPESVKEMIFVDATDEFPR